MKQRENNEDFDERGKFKPGNSHAWKKGQSGNPNGRRGGIRDILNKLLDEKVQDLTMREVLGKKLLHMAASGNLKALAMLLERSEGKVKDVVEQLSVVKLYHKDAPTEEV